MTRPNTLSLPELTDRLDAEEEDAVLLVGDALETHGGRAIGLLAIALGICLREFNLLHRLDNTAALIRQSATRPTTKRYFS